MKTFVIILLFIGVLRNVIKFGSAIYALCQKDNYYDQFKTFGWNRKTYARALPEHLVFAIAYALALTYFS